PLLRYTPIPFARGHGPLGFGSTHENSPLLCPIRGHWRKNKEKRRQKSGLDFAWADTSTQWANHTDKTQGNTDGGCANWRRGSRGELCAVWENSPKKQAGKAEGSVAAG